MSKPKSASAKRRAAAQRMTATQMVRQRIMQEISSGRAGTSPQSLFAATPTSLLLAIVGGMIDPLRLAHDQLAARGLSSGGQWVGFVVAEQLHRGSRS